MNVDMSVAPEIALLATPAPARRPAARPTIGTLAGRLRLVAGQPEGWWGAVRFNHCRSEKIDLEFPGFWIAVLAPGDPGIYCDCELMTVVAGEVTEESVAAGGGVTTALRPGRMRVHGQGQLHQIRAGGAGFAVSLHVRGGA
jgi:hypothetical protein